MPQRKTSKEVKSFFGLQEQISTTSVKVFVGPPLPTEPLLLKSGEQVAQDQECVAVVSDFRGTQEHTLEKQFT
jgi:hypothetical protein